MPSASVGGVAMYGVGLQSLYCWDCGLESR